MKKAFPIFLAALALSLIIAYMVNSGGPGNFLMMFGLFNLIIGFLSTLISLIIYFVDNETGKPWLLASGLLLLAGGLTCSVSVLQFN